MSSLDVADFVASFVGSIPHWNVKYFLINLCKMKTIKICSCIGSDNLSRIKGFLGIQNETEYGFKFEFTSINPDYIIASELIYYNSHLAKRFKSLIANNPRAIRVFRTGECISPDFNIFDYAIVFDRHLTDGDRVCRIPFNRYFAASLLVDQETIDYKKEILKKNKFCNFIYGNSGAHPRRDELFYALSNYKKVDSLGEHLNNTGVQSTRHSTDWRRLSIELRQDYKFSIAAENAVFAGYDSEKLVSCLQAGTIPIYWGDPTVDKDFNTKSFINCQEYNSIDEVVERVAEIDKNDDLWLEIASQPWMAKEQIAEMQNTDDNYIKFITNIFTQDLDRARRIGVGFYPRRYNEWFQNGFNPIQALKRNVEHLMRKIK